MVATRCASIPEIIKDDANGWLVEKQNAGDLAERILNLVNNPVLRQCMGGSESQKDLRAAVCTNKTVSA
jgi:glycosyltransferase involved in cell wall biosynthesis